VQKKKLIIFPFNGNGREALDCIDYDLFDFIGFADDDTSRKSDLYPVYTRNILTKQKELFVLAVPGSSTSFTKRKKIIDSLNISHDRFISVIHPNASIGKNVSIGYNCLIMAGVVLTSNCVIKNHVCILPNSVIHHDAIINEFTLIGSNVVIAGSTIVGSSCYIGSGSNIMNGISIEDNCLIGLGSNVIHSTEPDSKMVGNPARNINKRSSLLTAEN
jgi:sugar O-acyltransferase (sialic acid O-acetyltransferase NeuD family)